MLWYKTQLYTIRLKFLNRTCREEVITRLYTNGSQLLAILYSHVHACIRKQGRPGTEAKNSHHTSVFPLMSYMNMDLPTVTVMMMSYSLPLNQLSVLYVIVLIT